MYITCANKHITLSYYVVKKCTKCGYIQLNENFRYRSNVKDNLHSWCRDCERRANKERFVPKLKKTKSKKDPAVVKRKARDRMLKHRYGITLEKYNQMYLNQNGKCKICLDKYPNGGVKGLYVDHCHDTGTVRGLLCPRCNSMIGKFLEDEKLLKRSLEYLNSHS